MRVCPRASARHARPAKTLHGPTPHTTLHPPQALLARLQEQAAAAGAADPLGGTPLPSRCHALLRGLLGALWEGRRHEEVRLPLYSALTSYLIMCRGPALLRAPPAVVEALLAGKA